MIQALFPPYQVCEMKNCKKCVYFEMKKKKDLYMWVSNVPSGPSVKFLVENGKYSILNNVHSNVCVNPG